VAYDGGTQRIYVANRGSNTVSVVNGTTVVGTILVGNGPDGVAYNSGNGYVYATISYSNNVSVINGMAVLTSVPVGKQPSGVGYDPRNGYVYVANTGSNTTSVIATNAPPQPPSAPANLTAASGEGQVLLTWQPPASDGGATILNYTVYRSTVSGGEALLAIVGNVVSYVDSGLTPGRAYYYEVRAVNWLGEGPKSNEISGTPRPPSGSIPSFLPPVLVASGGILVPLVAAIYFLRRRKRRQTQPPGGASPPTG
jgi:YVTN family beta-propeller protein